MTPDDVLDIGQQTLTVVTMITAPPLLFALTVGLIVGMFQAATQINEQTLSFIPKLFALAAVIFMAGPWMLDLMLNFTTDLFQSIPNRIG
ncbi:MAG: flagellar biosynthesis protein FliQ [Gammaproteobacteria bacterium]|nr:flagellar biosynthesis protein FliQ [Gammaproteobacteria bacterium]